MSVLGCGDVGEFLFIIPEEFSKSEEKISFLKKKNIYLLAESRTKFPGSSGEKKGVRG